MRTSALALTTGLPLGLGLSTLIYQGYGHHWWRGHAGDAFVVAFLVGLLGSLTDWSLPRRLLLVAVVAAALEVGQLAAGAASRSEVTGLFLGSHFDALDFIYYAAGLVLAAILEVTRRSRETHPTCPRPSSGPV